MQHPLLPQPPGRRISDAPSVFNGRLSFDGRLSFAFVTRLTLPRPERFAAYNQTHAY